MTWTDCLALAAGLEWLLAAGAFMAGWLLGERVSTPTPPRGDRPGGDDADYPDRDGR